jgi:hypothetical protein
MPSDIGGEPFSAFKRQVVYSNLFLSRARRDDESCPSASGACPQLTKKIRGRTASIDDSKSDRSRRRAHIGQSMTVGAVKG